MQRHAREMQNNAERESLTQSLALNRLVRPLSVPEASPPLVAQEMSEILNHTLPCKPYPYCNVM